MSGSGFIRSMARAAAQAERARVRQAKQSAALARASERNARVSYQQSRSFETDELNKQISDDVLEIETLLAGSLKRKASIRQSHFYHPPAEVLEKPAPERFLPRRLGFFAKLVPGARARHAQAVEQGQQALSAESARVAEENAKRRAVVSKHNAEIDAAFARYAGGEHDCVVWYFERLIERSLINDCDATSVAVGYSHDSRQLVVDLELPTMDAVPNVASYKYVKTADRIDETPRTPAKRKALYASLIAQITLKCLDTIFRGGGDTSPVTSVTLNGMLDAIDLSTGQDVRVCLISVRVTRDTFAALNLAQVSPEQCLRSLKASVSRSPSELVPVKPILELDMVDPRFIDTQQVLSKLEGRPNLMELTPGEFEGLITNLFATMGLDTKQTQASRDGGVDCVAFDSRPIFGGKVVIQAEAV